MSRQISDENQSSGAAGHVPPGPIPRVPEREDSPFRRQQDIKELWPPIPQSFLLSIKFSANIAMSPYEPIPPSVESGYFDKETHSYSSEDDFDTDSDDAGFADDIDGAPFTREDSARILKEETNAAIDAQHALLNRKYGQPIHQTRNRCGQAKETQAPSRYANFQRSPCPTFEKQLTCSPPSE